MKGKNFSSVERTSHWSDFLSQRVDSSRPLCSLTDLFTDQKLKMKVSSFINRLHLCTIDWEKRISKRKIVRFFDEFSLRKDDHCRQVKDQRRNQSMFCRSVVLPESNDEKFDEIWWRLAQSLCSTENLTVTTVLFLFRRFVQLYSRKTQIVRRTDFQRPSNDKISCRRIDWKNQRFFFEGKKRFFSSFEYFYPERKRSKDLFISTHWDRSKTVEEKQFSRSFKFAATEKSTNRRWKSQWKWEKKNEK